MTKIDSIKAQLESITPGFWAVTHWSGGFSFSGPPVVYCETNEMGEPAIISRGSTEADSKFIADAPETIRFLLKKIEELEKKNNNHETL